MHMVMIFTRLTDIHHPELYKICIAKSAEMVDVRFVAVWLSRHCHIADGGLISARTKRGRQAI